MHAEVSWIVTYLNTVIAGFVEADAALGARRRSCIVVSLSKHMGERERERENQWEEGIGLWISLAPAVSSPGLFINDDCKHAACEIS